MKKTLALSAALVLLVALVALVGCSASSSAKVSVTEGAFTPAEVTIKAGGTVTWTNEGVTAHTVTFPDSDSESVYPKQTYSRTFEKPGTYDYYCRLHTTEKGTVEVK